MAESSKWWKKRGLLEEGGKGENQTRGGECRLGEYLAQAGPCKEKKGHSGKRRYALSKSRLHRGRSKTFIEKKKGQPGEKVEKQK